MEHVQKKSLGQHWLQDADSLQAMVTFAGAGSNDTVLEIGPGLGTLTKILLASGASVVAVEYDEYLYQKLQREAESIFGETASHLQMVYGDILQFDLSSLPPNYKVAANIPYYLTSKLVRVLSESTNPPESVTLLIQKEVAQRLAAAPGGMSLLTVSSGMYFEPSLGPIVPAKLFTPPPKVDSQIIHLKRRPLPLFGEMDPKQLFRVVKAGFSARRKTLLNSLSAGLQQPKEETANNLQIATIDPRQRPQELSLEQWIRLAEIMK